MFTSETSIQNVLNMALYNPYKHKTMATKLKTSFCLSHLIKREWLMFSLRQYCLDFSIFPMFTFQPHLLPTISWWTRNKNEKCLKHDIVHPCQMYKHDRFNCNAFLSNYYFFSLVRYEWTLNHCLYSKHENQPQYFLNRIILNIWSKKYFNSFAHFTSLLTEHFDLITAQVHKLLTTQLYYYTTLYWFKNKANYINEKK